MITLPSTAVSDLILAANCSGELPLASAALFDLGVYLVVVGATLLTISVLGTVSRETQQAASPHPPEPAA